MKERIQNAFGFEFCNAVSFEIILGIPLVLYAQSLGAGPTTLGLLAGMVYAFAPLQLFAVGWAARVGFKQWIVLGWIGRTLLIVIFILLPLNQASLGNTLTLGILTTTLALFCLLLNGAACAWLPWITALVPDRERPWFLARERAFIFLGGLLTMTLTVLLLRQLSSSRGFAATFAVSLLGGMAAVHFLKGIPATYNEPSAAGLEDAKPVAWLAILHDRPVIGLIFVNVLWIIFQASLCVFGAIFLAANKALGEWQILTGVIFLYLGALAILLPARQIMEKKGELFLLRVAVGCAAVGCAAWFAVVTDFLPPSLPVRAGLWCLGGAGMAGFQVGYLRLLMTRVPAQNSGRHFALNATTDNWALWLSPVLWGAIIEIIKGNPADPLTGSIRGYQVFYAVSFLGLCGLGLILRPLLYRPIPPDRPEKNQAPATAAPGKFSGEKV